VLLIQPKLNARLQEKIKEQISIYKKQLKEKAFDIDRDFK